MTASHFALMMQYALASLHVGCKLTMTSLPGASSTTSFGSSSRFRRRRFLVVFNGMSHDGLIWSKLPSTRLNAADAESRSASDNSFFGSRSSQSSPHPVRSSEVRDSRVARDSRPRVHDASSSRARQQIRQDRRLGVDDVLFLLHLGLPESAADVRVLVQSRRVSHAVHAPHISRRVAR